MKKLTLVIFSVLLIIGSSILVVRGINHVRIAYQEQKRAESISERKKRIASQAETRRKVALWVVQHYEIPEPIKEVGVSEVETFGLFGSGGSAVSVIFNNNDNYTLSGVGVEKNGNPMGRGAVYDGKYVRYAPDKNRTLDGIKVTYWKGEEND